jgi:hypothetical protein
VLPGASPALGSTSPGRHAESCAQLPCSPGTSPALGSTSLGVRVFCPRLRRCSCLRLLPVGLRTCAPPRLCRCSCLRSLPVCRRASAAAAASARCPCAAASPPLQLPPRRFLQSVLCALCVLCCAMCSYFLALCTVSSICALRAVFCYLRCPFWQLPTRVRSC